MYHVDMSSSYVMIYNIPVDPPKDAVSKGGEASATADAAGDAAEASADAGGGATGGDAAEASACATGETGGETTVSVKQFCAMEIESLSQDRKITELRTLAHQAIDLVTNQLPPPSKGWRAHMPIWKNKNNKKTTRGLKSWVKDESFCFTWLQDGVEFYAQTIGAPPVITGTKKKTKKRKRGVGHTRGQHVLSEARGANLIDYKSIFVLVVAAHYCLHARPVVEDGTDASHAVIAVLMEPATLKAVLSTVCNYNMS